MSSSAFLQLGNIFLKNKQHDKAAKIFNLFIEDFPEDFRGYFNLGKALCCQSLNNSRVQLAILNFEKALSLNPDIVDAHVSIAALHIKSKEPRLAVTHCQAGLQLDGLNLECMFNLNIALRQLDRLAEAVELTRSQIPSMGQVTLVQECHFLPAVALLKWGSKYGQEYVDRLTGALKQHLGSHINYSIICFTDALDQCGADQDGSAVTYRLLPDLSAEHWTGWWYKAYLFSQASGLSGHVLYLDLDTVVCSGLDFLGDTLTTAIHVLCTPKTPPLPKEFSSRGLSCDCDVEELRAADDCEVMTMTAGSTRNRADPVFFACLKASGITNEGRLCGINSSIMLWNASTPASSSNYMHYLFSYLRENYAEVTRVMYKFDHFLELMLADRKGKFEGVIFLQDEFPNKIIDFQCAEKIFASHDEGGAESDDVVDVTAADSAAVVCFPLHPKPHQVVDRPWVQKYWKLDEIMK